MAIPRLRVKPGKKGGAAPHAAYIAREGIYANRLEKGEKLEATEFGNMPAWAQHDPQEFWKAADEFERKNGAAYRELEIALPRELNEEQRLALVREFVAQEIGDRHAYQFAIHTPTAVDGKDQPHAHVMFSEKQVDGIDRDPEQYFKKHLPKTPEKGGAKKSFEPLEAKSEMSVDKKAREAERAQLLKDFRGRWETMCNQHLERAGSDQRIDMRSYRDQGVDKQPERKMLPSEARQHKADVLEFKRAQTEVREAIPNMRAEIIDLELRRHQRAAEHAPKVDTPPSPAPANKPGLADLIKSTTTLSGADAFIAERKAAMSAAPAPKVDTPAPVQPGKTHGEHLRAREAFVEQYKVKANQEIKAEMTGPARAKLDAVRAEIKDKRPSIDQRSDDAARREREAMRAADQHTRAADQHDREADQWLAANKFKAMFGTKPADDLRARADAERERAQEAQRAALKAGEDKAKADSEAQALQQRERHAKGELEDAERNAGYKVTNDRWLTQAKGEHEYRKQNPDFDQQLSEREAVKRAEAEAEAEQKAQQQRDNPSQGQGRSM
jgi:hypothetical protein